MMSQLRQRKAPSAVSGNASRTRGSPCTASGDSATYNVHAKQRSQRSRSKNKIPKSIRYDLDNALVGLCDVWFEEIKPHLVRNNIKVHVDQNGEGAGPASGDHDQLPPGAPGCSHLDPGAASYVQEHHRQVASSAVCYSTPPIASKAQCHKPRSPTSLRLPPAPSHHPESPHRRLPKTQNPFRNYNDNSEQRPRLRRSRRVQSQMQPQPPQYCRVPRPCRTYSTSPNVTPRRSKRTIRTVLQPPSPTQELNYFQFIRPKRKSRTRNKWTQTDSPCPMPRWSPTRLSATPTMINASAKSTSVPTRQNCDDQRQHRGDNRFPLFPNDLVDIIGEKYDKRLRVLYKSPRVKEVPSQMHLILTPKCHQTKVDGARKHLAWR